MVFHEIFTIHFGGKIPLFEIHVPTLVRSTTFFVTPTLQELLLLLLLLLLLEPGEFSLGVGKNTSWWEIYTKLSQTNEPWKRNTRCRPGLVELYVRDYDHMLPIHFWIGLLKSHFFWGEGSPILSKHDLSFRKQVFPAASRDSAVFGFAEGPWRGSSAILLVMAGKMGFLNEDVSHIENFWFLQSAMYLFTRGEVIKVSKNVTVTVLTGRKSPWFALIFAHQHELVLFWNHLTKQCHETSRTQWKHTWN